MSFKILCNLFIACVLSIQISYASRSDRVIRDPIESESIEQDLLMAIQEAPIHRNIPTTVFWVGERSRLSGWSDNLDSAWDARWKENFGGLDSPVFRKGFFPARFRPKQNPFYIALPFNDITHPEYLDTCPILQYFKAQKEGRKIHSVCKNRWIEITYNGKICYAQWQDVGPVNTDDYNYVFGGEEPRAKNQEIMAALDISPAIRDFLKIKGAGQTSWRFVEESSIPNGPWKTIVTRS